MSIKTEIGFTTPEEITVRGHSLTDELLGKIDFADMLYLVAYGQMPHAALKNMINAILVTACDHGMTPSATAARLTYLGAPESLQGAIAAGILGAGSHFLGTVQDVADMLIHETEDLSDDISNEDLSAHAEKLIRRYRANNMQVPGVGHPIHIQGDPRIPTLIDISKVNGFHNRYWRLAQALPDAMKTVTGKARPLNAAGGCGAMLAEMQLDPIFGRGLMIVGRTAGLVAHIMEERVHPTGQEIWDLLLSQDIRNVAPPAQGGV